MDPSPPVLIFLGCTVLARSPEFGAHSGALDGLQYTSVIHATRRARDRHAAIDEIERQVLRPNDRPDFALEKCHLVSAVHSVDFEDDAVRTLGNHLVRSEEHTSELQSLMRISYAVFCLKKKKKN